jgi:hypothetical protein
MVIVTRYVGRRDRSAGGAGGANIKTTRAADLGWATAPLDFAWCLVMQTIPTAYLWTKDAGTSHYSPATRSSVHAMGFT